MEYLGKEYSYVSHENFDTFLKSVGVPEEKVEEFESNFKPTIKIVENEDGTFTNFTTIDGVTKTVTFTSGVEFDDTIGPDNLPVKSTIIVDGNSVVQLVKSVKTEDDHAVFNKVYDGDDLVVTISSSKMDGLAKRYYKA